MVEDKEVDSYIDGAPVAVQPLMRDLRRIIFDAAPAVTEKISYGMPTYEQDGRRLLCFALAKRHIGVYGLVHVDRAVPEPLAGYVDHRSTLRFGFDGPLPTAAITEAIHRKIQATAGRGDPRSTEHAR
jgi:uncharacterized protein YdhG (YjbR/CyaY superfamily)